MSKKYIEEIDELNANEHIHENTPKKTKNIRRVVRIFFIGFLSVLCIIGIVLIHKLHKDAQKNPSSTVTRFNRIVQSKMPSLTPTGKGLVLSDKSSNAVSPKSFSVPTEPVFVPSDNIPIQSAALPELTPTSDVISDVQPSDVQEKAVVNVSRQKSDYTLHQALMFKEHFLKGQTCTQDYQQLMNTQYKTPEMLTVLNNLSPYCANTASARQNIKHVFLKEKKRALIAGYEMKDVQWVAYVKALVVSVIEIRKLNPTTSKPKDIIYQAQNELYHQNIRQAVALLKTLPPHMQDAMSHFFREADIYIRADDSLNKLILSFESAGE